MANHSDMVRGSMMPQSMILTPRWYPLRPHAEQLRLLTATSRFRVVACGRRSGKTELAKRYGVKLALSESTWTDARFGFGAPTRQQAKELFWLDLKRLMSTRFMSRRPSESELRIDLINGASLQVCGLDRPQRIEGRPWNWFVIDEIDDCRPETWEEAIRPALSDRAGGAWFTGVPNGRGFLYQLKCRAENREGWSYHWWPSADILSASEIEDAQRDLDPRTFRQEYEASFELASGRVCYAFERAENVREFTVPESVRWHACMDFNVHPMTAACGWVDGETIYVWQDWHVPTASTYEVGSRILGVTGKRAIMFPDPSGMHRDTRSGTNDHEILRELGFKIRARPACPSPRSRNNALNSRLCSAAGVRRMIIHPRCQHLIDALEGLLYKNGEEEKNDYQHIVSALGFWAENLFPIRPRKTFKGVKF